MTKKSINTQGSCVKSQEFSSYKKINDTFWDRVEKHELTSSQLALCFSLTKYLKYDSNIAICSLREVEESSRISKKTILKNLIYLEHAGFIQRLQSKGYKNSYILSYAYVGIIEKQHTPKEVHEIEAYNSKIPGAALPQGVGENRPTSIYKVKKTTKQRYKKRKDFVFPKKKMGDDFFGKRKIENQLEPFKEPICQKKMDLCKRYLENLKTLGRIQIKASEAQYLMTMYEKNDATDSWANLDARLGDLEAEISQQKNRVYVYPDETTDTIKKETPPPSNADTYKQLENMPDYNETFNQVFVRLQTQNSMLKDPNSEFAKRLVHSEMVEGA